MNFKEEEELFAEYFTSNFVPNWNSCPHEVKVQLDLVFKLFLSNFISSNQLLLISKKFIFDISKPTSLLICACEKPEKLSEQLETGRCWSQLEKLLLVTCYVKCNGNFNNLRSFLPRRSLDSCRFEMSRIIHSYSKNHEFHKPKIAEETKESTFSVANEKINETQTINDENVKNKNSIVISKTSHNNQISKQKYSAEKKRLKEKENKQQLKFARKSKIIKNNCQQIQQENESQLEGFEKEFSIILSESRENFALGRGKRYSNETKAFWMRLRMYSRKAFFMMKDYLGGPSESTIDRWIKNSKNCPSCSDLENIDQVFQIFLFWKEKLRLPDETNFSISIDAAKVDENLSIRYDGKVSGTVDLYNLPKDPIKYFHNPELYRQLWDDLLNQKKLITHIFVITMCPITKKRGFPIYVKFTNSGSATKNVTNDLKRIIFQLVSQGIKIRFIGSDSDQCYRKKFNKQFQQVIKTIFEGRMDLSLLSNECILYSNDAYHCLKRLRKSMINSGSLFIKPDDIGTPNCVSKFALQKIDKSLPDCIFRKGSMQSMDDYYPHALFNKKTLMKAQKNNNSAVTLYLWIGVLVRKIISGKKLSRIQRCEMCHIGLLITIIYKSFLEKWKQNNVPRKILSLMIMSPDMCTDLSNFFTSMIKALTTIDEPFPLSRIGSILSEHFFSRIRGNAGNSQTADSIRASISKIQFIDAFRVDEEFDEANHIRKLNSAVVEKGAVTFDEIEINKCIGFANALLNSAGLFIQYGDFGYDLMSRPLYVDDEELLIMKYFNVDLKNEKDTKKRWILNAANFRVNGRYGRNIKGRYITAAKHQ